MTKKTHGDYSPAEGNTPDASGDEFVFVGEHVNLALRPKTPSSQPRLIPKVQISSIESKNAFLVSVDPPVQPADHSKHVPCDIVLVIDVSGSMAALAPLPDAKDQKEREATGLTVLDLVRHACRTIISTLNEGDRLALVTFSQEAKVVASLNEMTKASKDHLLEKIEKLTDEGATNLWAGIKAGLKEFETHPPVGNIQGLYVLTDGMPNYMCPQQGYVPKLQPLLEQLTVKNGSMPAIHTFGFGYTINSGLMLSIAKAGHGNFSFIPDVGMIGTSFVHAIANLYSTYAIHAVLELTHGDLGGDDMKHESGLPTRTTSTSLTIELGSIQYGQSRDLIVGCPPALFQSGTPVKAKLTYHHDPRSPSAIEVTHHLHQPSDVTQPILDYHLSRDLLCRFFSHFYPVNRHTLQHIRVAKTTVLCQTPPEFDALVSTTLNLPNASTDPNLQSLLIDLIGPSLSLKSVPDDTSGQIHQALNNTPQTDLKSYWERWGSHYLASLWCAHMRQICNSFKDAGPLRYGLESPLFNRCKEELDSTFDTLDPPKGTWRGGPPAAYANAQPHVFGGDANARSTTSFSMRSYNSRHTPCVLGHCLVKLTDDSLVEAQELKAGMSVWNPILKRGREIKEVVKGVNAAGGDVCRVGSELWITPWHPVCLTEDTGTRKWVFPASVQSESRILANGEFVYSVLLEADELDRHNPDAHAIEVSGIPCVTLGHGVMSTGADGADADVRAHSFFGDHKWVSKRLKGLTCDSLGRRLCGGLIREHTSGLVCGVFDASSIVEEDGPKARL